MKVYLVGGAIRDKLLGLTPKEKDWVVVNSNPSQLIELGYKQVGKKFPVFLHPETFEEYALARLEKKTNKGHKGFEFDTSESVTLEQDLLRRDITINAIAQDDNGDLIDPHNGITDLENRIIRHVSDAFSEDPLRIFRVARFYCVLSDYNFTIHEATYEVMKNIVKSGEIEDLSRERLWTELSKAFNSKNPWKFFDVLIKTNAAEKYFPEVMSNDLIRKKIIYFSNTNIEKDIFLSILGFSVDFIELFGFPKKIIDLYFIFNEFITKFISLEMQDKSILNFLNSLDAFRRPERLKAFLIQAQYFIDFHKMKEGEKINIFIKINNIIENKIDYGNLTNKNVEDIKRNIENINLNIINSILLNKKH